MNISRKQLYALGEPFGDCATRKKLGGRIYGGGSPSTPADTTSTTTAELPDWARGYAKDTLAKASALTDINTNPYQQYGGERIAGFQPMQQQAFQGAANMQPSAQVGLGSGIAGMAGVGALGTNFQGGQFQGGQFDTQAAQQYMNPYTQNVVDYQKSQALRDFQIAQPMRQAQAVQQGAFGGSRSAIVDAEAQRSLNSQLQGITATGQQAAFQQAQQQFNADQARNMQAQQLGEQSRQYGAGLGMQGLQTGLQAASTLGQLGQTQYGQQMGINQLQSQYGQQQQQQAQRPLDMAYQDFMNQQNYPYKQLGFMSDMIRGLPLGQQSTSQMYQAPPSTLQTVGALGLGAYGLNQLSKADGGLLGAYAGGGMVAFGNGGDTDVTDSPMDDPTKMAKAVADLSDEQLKQVIQNPSSAVQLQAAKMELATRASESRGLASAYNMMPEQAPSTQATPQAPQAPQMAQQPMMQAAKGGIMHFKNAGQVGDGEPDEEEVTAALDPSQLFSGNYSPGNQANFDMFNQEILKSMENVRKYQPSAPMTDQERRAATTANYREVQAMAGPDPYKAQADRIAGLENQQAGELGQQKGLAALAAIPAVLQGGNALRGLGGGAGAFAGMYGKALQADRAEKRALMSMKNNLEDAQYKMRVGMVGDARQLTAEARRDKQAADTANIAKQKALGSLAAQGATLNKPQRPLAARGTGSGAAKPPKVNELLADAEINFANNPSEANRKRVEALRSTIAQIKTSDTGPTKAGAATSELSSKEALAAAQNAKKAALRNEDWQNANTQAEKDAVEQRLYEEELEKIQSGKQKLGAEKPAPAAKPPAVQPLPANPKDPKSYKDGVVYSTPNGNGKWNAKTQKFTAVP
jgi:hypothetical protein